MFGMIIRLAIVLATTLLFAGILNAYVPFSQQFVIAQYPLKWIHVFVGAIAGVSFKFTTSK